MGQDLRSKFYVEGTNYGSMVKVLGQQALLKKHGGSLDNRLHLGKLTTDITQEFAKEFESEF